MKRFLALALGLLCGCAWEEYYVGDCYDEAFPGQGMVTYEGTAPGYSAPVPGTQPSLPAPPPAPGMTAQPAQTKEPPLQ